MTALPAGALLAIAMAAAQAAPQSVALTYDVTLNGMHVAVIMFLDLGHAAAVEFPMTNGRKLDRYRYAVTPSVPLDTPLGRIETLHLVKQREPGDTVTEIWLAPQYRHLPVKMLVVENDGSRYEQIITGIDLRP